MPPKFSYEDGFGFLYAAPTAIMRQPPCQAACPAGAQVSLINRLVASGRTEKAAEVLLSAIPFPELVCGRCTRPCEKACNKGQQDAPVPISRIARHAASCACAASGKTAEPSKSSALVVGNSLAGLTAAFYLRKLGHAVSLYGPAAGQDAAIYDLPADFYAKAKKILQGLGVEFEEGAAPALDEALLKTYRAVILADGKAEAPSLPGFFSLAPEGKSLALAVGKARLAAVQADACIRGYDFAKLGLLGLEDDGSIGRVMLPLNQPENAKPVTVVRYSNLHNLDYFEENKPFYEEPLRPESLAREASACFHCGKCMSCGTCVMICPGDILEMRDGKPTVVYPYECIHCSACMVDCPCGAITFHVPLPMTIGTPAKYIF